MKELLIKNGCLISVVDAYDKKKCDIHVVNGKIQKIGENLSCDCEILDVEGKFISAGLIDSHVHCFAEEGSSGVAPDELGIARGATTIIDAGSSGPENYAIFREKFIEPAKTKVFTLLNVSKKGLQEKRELDSLDKIDGDFVSEVVKKYPENIVGLKARASATVVGEMGIAPIEMAKDISRETGLPLMVHVGNMPPRLEEVLDLLEKGDIVTHPFHGKKGGIVKEDNSDMIPEARKAKERGVLFDIGHGEASFAYKTFEKVSKLGFGYDSISTDLHRRNYEGPVYTMALTMSKLLNLGCSLEEVVDKSTYQPAKIFGLKDLGRLQEGYIADFFVFELVDTKRVALDADGDELVLEQEIKPVYTIFSRGEETDIHENRI